MLKQGQTNILLQLLHLDGDRRLAEIKGLRRTGKTQQTRHMFKDLKLSQSEIHGSTFINKSLLKM